MDGTLAVSLLLAVGLACAALQVDAASVEPRPGEQPGEWLRPQYDPGRTGRVPLAGRITAPRIAWQLDTSSRDYWVSVEPAAGSSALALSDALELKPLPDAQTRSWGLAPAPLDIAGDGHPVAPPLTYGCKWGRFLPGVPGLQRLGFTNGWIDEAYLQLHSFEDGVEKPRLVWQVLMKPSYLPMAAILDVDADGRQEAAISRWYGVAVYDLQTGAEKYVLDYRKDYTRPYGFFGAYANTDGRAYMVSAGTFCGYITSLAVRDGKLKELWTHLLDGGEGQGTYFRQTINSYVPESLGDFSGDGRGEMLMNLYNGAGDNRWHLLAYDLETGEPSLDLPDVYLRGVADLDGDGRKELVCQHCPGRPVGTNGELRVYDWDRLLWTHPYSRWCLYPAAMMPLTSESYGDYSGRNVLVKWDGEGEGDTVFFTAHGSRGETVRSLRLGAKKRAKTETLVGAPAGASVDAAGTAPGRLLVKAHAGREDALRLQSRAGSLRVEGVSRSAPMPPVPVVARDGKGRPRIVLGDDTEQVQGYEVGRAGGAPREVWRHRGHGMSRSGIQNNIGLVAGDMNGDGRPEVLAAQEAPDGHARFVGIGLDGKERWRLDVEGFGGRTPQHNESGIQAWYLGHFLDPRRLDLAYLALKNIYVSGEVFVADTAARQHVWSRDRTQIGGPGRRAPFQEMHYTPQAIALGDLDGDGLQDILTGWPGYIAVKGSTGAQIAADWFGWCPKGSPAISGEMVDGKPLSVYVDPVKTGAYVCDGGSVRAVWELPDNEGAHGVPAVGDSDGDGRLEAGVPGFKDGFRCLDARTGAVLWTVPLPPDVQPEQCSNCVCCDIDGDGREEFLFAAGRRLVAASPRAKDHIVWALDLPATIWSVVVADVDGDGKVEALCGGTDGILYCVQ